MQIYLPIAEVSVNVFSLIAIGGGIGFLSGLFGVGGGFLITPLLLFLQIPPAVAVATGANQIVGTSVASLLPHWRRGNVDVKMGLMLLAGGLAGSAAGVWAFSALREMGQIDLVINASYVVFLGIIGGLMLVESTRAILASRQPAKKKKPSRHHNWLHGLPFKMRFRKSGLYISAIGPILVGAMVGVLAAIMGVGGGFIMVPAMIYLLGMPTAVVVGTSLFQILFVTAEVTVLQATANYAVDVPLALILMLGGVVGAQFGVRVGAKLKGEQLRGLLALLVLAVCIKLFFDMTAEPADHYVLQIAGD